ncbi:MAG: methyltransferase domain-containing protein [Candidatus Sulfotelmatobacter sp.]|jgi:SAM-dependent methyltransferase
MAKTAYSKDFFNTIREGSRRSAHAVVPVVLDFIRPKSVVDVGCGDGTWLSVFREFGVNDTFGVDGDYVSREALRIPREQFMPIDLSSRFDLGRKFDLAVSLEVAEHLPAASAADFIDSLVKLAPVVVFSAAIPHQGGTHHVNEQWPDYWVDHFRRHDYVPIDCIRGRLWHDDSVEWWYVQNSFVFVSPSALAENEKLQNAFHATNPEQLNIVHPRFYLAFAQEHYRVRTALATLLRALKDSVGRRLKRRPGNLP